MSGPRWMRAPCTWNICVCPTACYCHISAVLCQKFRSYFGCDDNPKGIPWNIKTLFWVLAKTWRSRTPNYVKLMNAVLKNGERTMTEIAGCASPISVLTNKFGKLPCQYQHSPLNLVQHRHYRQLSLSDTYELTELIKALLCHPEKNPPNWFKRGRSARTLNSTCDNPYFSFDINSTAFRPDSHISRPNCSLCVSGWCGFGKGGGGGGGGEDAATRLWDKKRVRHFEFSEIQMEVMTQRVSRSMPLPIHESGWCWRVSYNNNNNNRRHNKDRQMVNQNKFIEFTITFRDLEWIVQRSRYCAACAIKQVYMTFRARWLRKQEHKQRMKVWKYIYLSGL